MIRLILLSLACGLVFGAARAQVSLPKSPTMQKVEGLVARTQSSHLLQRTSATSITNNPCYDPIRCFFVSLPVRLVSFYGIRKDAETVHLFWETATEANNDFFLIEKSFDPESGFETVAKVQGRGTVSSTTRYEVPDGNSSERFTYYRLKQVDYDGTFTYSKIIGVEGTSVPFNVLAVPNPAPASKVAFAFEGIRTKTSLSLTIYDGGGRVVFHRDRYSLSPEMKNIHLALTYLPIGTYHLKARNKELQTTTTFVIVRD